MEDKKFKCPFCGNEDKKYFGIRNSEIYCRYCIGFHGELATENVTYETSGKNFISYCLTNEQKEASGKILDNYVNKLNTLVHAVTGAGKTELVFQVISYCLERKLNVGFAIPRKDVVIELFQRISEAYKTSHCVAVYGGHTEELYGNIIVLTTHQIYRYERYFDLLILDEIDAFPYKDNSLLQSMFYRSVKGNFVLLTATPSDQFKSEFVKKGGRLVELLVRFHHNKLPVPRMVIKMGLFKYTSLLHTCKKFVKEEKPFLIFVPSIDESYYLFKFLSLFIKNGYYVNSKLENRTEIIQKFRYGQFKFLVTTSVLERGVTIDNLQVIVFNADNALFDEITLVQIAGRVGRKIKHPNGEVVYISYKCTSDMKLSIKRIRDANLHLINEL